MISEEWIKSVQQPSEAYESYGYMWWLNRGDRAHEGVPASIYFAVGFGGNYIVVDNENDLVIVTRWLQPSELGDFLRKVIGALE